MVMKFYATSTPNVQRAILPLYLADVDPEKEMKMVLVSLSGKQQHTPAFKAKNPFARVPYLEDGDIGVFESRAIANYLVGKYSLTHLVGQTPKERAVIDQWVQSEAQSFDPAALPILLEVWGAKRANRPLDENLVATKLAALSKVLDVYEAELSKHKYLASDTYTLADAFHTPLMAKVNSLDAFAETFVGRPHFKAWADAITSNPAYVKTTQMDWDNATPL